MRRALRLALVVVGLAIAVYGIASLTGEWLGTPPWWESRLIFHASQPGNASLVGGPGVEGPSNGRWVRVAQVGPQPRPGREWISGGVVAVGLWLVVVGIWPRRRPLISALRLTLVLLGLTLAIHGGAWLAGGWLGTPPWVVQILGEYRINGHAEYLAYDPPRIDEDRRGESNLWAAGAIAVGLALAAFAAWPRSSRAAER
jgi:hypothetical protein